MEKILKIREVGDPVLYKVSEEVDIQNIDDKILDIIKDLKETLKFSEGYGIAAPQVGINKRIIIIEVDKEKCPYNNCENVPNTVMLNPIWKNLSQEIETEFEGCLSVPSIRGKVDRYKEIEVIYYNINGEQVVRNVSGFTARDIQHECDHLDGILFLNKVKEANGFATREMINKFRLKD